MKKINNFDFYSSRFMDFYLSGTISFVSMMNLLSLPFFLDLLSSNFPDSVTVDCRKDFSK